MKLSLIVAFSLALLTNLTLFSIGFSNEKNSISNDKPQTSLWKSEESWSDVKENVEMAITDLGLKISGTMHISDMLNRTGKDLGFEKEIYEHAEGLEFCSAEMSHKMAQVDPSNIAMCPFTIVFYEKKDEAGTVYIGFRSVKLNGDAAQLEKEIYTMLKDLVESSIE